MRKLLLALFAAALLVAFTAPVYAADFKFSGFFRLRGLSSDNTDRNDDKHDGIQYFDALSRPRFTAKTYEGKAFVVWEPEWTNANGGFTTAGRHAVGTNRWVVDFAVPGSALRARWGRTDYVSPDKEIFDSFGRSRKPGLALYGKLSNSVSLSMFNTKTKEDTTGASDDADAYYLGLAFKASPNLTLTPWIANSRDSKSNMGYDYWYGALHAKGKVGIMSFRATGVYQSGTVSEGGTVTLAKATTYPTMSKVTDPISGEVSMKSVSPIGCAGGGTECAPENKIYPSVVKPSSKMDRPDVDVSAWGFILRTSFAMGKLKLMANLVSFSGDDDPIVAAGHQALQPDKELSRFTFPGLGGYGWVEGGHIMTSRRWTTHGNSVRTVTLTGNGSNKQLNGANVLEGLFEYKVSKTFTVGGGISFYQSAESAPNICNDANKNTVCDAGEAMETVHDESKDFGTEFNLGFKWKLYPKTELRVVGAYLFAGDYGRVEMHKGQTINQELDDTWVASWTLRHFF